MNVLTKCYLDLQRFTSSVAGMYVFLPAISTRLCWFLLDLLFYRMFSWQNMSYLFIILFGFRTFVRDIRAFIVSSPKYETTLVVFLSRYWYNALEIEIYFPTITFFYLEHCFTCALEPLFPVKHALFASTNNIYVNEIFLSGISHSRLHPEIYTATVYFD